MRHAFVAVFDSTDAAFRAIHAAREAGLAENQLSFVVNRGAGAKAVDVNPVDESLEHSDIIKDTAKGLIVGAAGGMLTVALVAGPVGWFGAGWLAMLAFGGSLGGVFGGVAEAIIGQGFPRDAVEPLKVELEARNVLVTVETDTEAHEAQVEEILARFGAHRTLKAAL